MTSDIFLSSVALSRQPAVSHAAHTSTAQPHSLRSFSGNMHCWTLVALLLSTELGNVVGSSKVFNVTGSPHDDLKIPRFPSDVDNVAVLRDYIFLRDWFVAPHLLSTSVAASDNIRSPLCRNQNRLFLQELRNFTLWAVQSEYSIYSL
jgi:hypothetical protein